MNFENFIKTISETEPPVSLSPQLIALWYDANGDWEKAHDLINDIEGKEVAWVHAYLHRKEGDVMNANYWYSRAGKPEGKGDLDAERAAIVRALLG